MVDDRRQQNPYPIPPSDPDSVTQPIPPADPDGGTRPISKRAERRLWTLGGQRYDLRGFASEHPGGEHAIWSALDLDDATLLFLSYHPPASAAKLQPFLVPSASADSAPRGKVVLPRRDPLLDDLHARVGAAFGKPVHHLKCPPWGWLVNFVLGALYAAACYRWATMPTVLSALSFGTLGFVFAGFIAHEGSHHALSRRHWLNQAGRYLLLPWADVAVWFQRHAAAGPPRDSHASLTCISSPPSAPPPAHAVRKRPTLAPPLLTPTQARRDAPPVHQHRARPGLSERAPDGAPPPGLGVRSYP